MGCAHQFTHNFLDIYKNSATILFMTKSQKNIKIVLTRLIAFAEQADKQSADSLSVSLNGFLDDLKGDDFFGTEAQMDPRGDGREGEFTMDRIQK